jgi:hypothetical protein
MKSVLRLSTLSAAAGILLASPGPARAQLLITGNDEKVSFRREYGQDDHAPGRQRHGVDHRYRRRCYAEDHRQSAADQHDYWTAGQSSDQPRSAPGAGRQFARLGQGRRWLEGCSRQQDLRHRFDCVAAHADRHGRGGKQASGMAINRAGTLALVANRAEDWSPCWRSTAKM